MNTLVVLIYYIFNIYLFLYIYLLLFKYFKVLNIQLSMFVDFFTDSNVNK